MKTNLVDIGKGMTQAELLSAYQMSELENSNCRRIVLWAAERLPPVHRAELAKLLNKSLVEGGVSTDASEDAALTNRETLNLFDSIIESYSRVLKIGQVPHNSMHMVALVRQAKEKLAKLRRPSLAYHRITR